MSGRLLSSLRAAALLAALAAIPALAQTATPAPATPAPRITATPYAGLAPEVFTQARTALDAGDFSAALLRFSIFLSLNPASSQAYFGQALSWLGLERPEDALESITHAIDTAPDNPGYRAALYSAQAQVHIALEQPEAAVEDLVAAIALNPTPLAYAERARLYLQLEDYESAIADLDAALAITPGDPSLLLFRAFLNNQLFAPSARGLRLDVVHSFRSLRICSICGK